jgi:hypothetical protein
MARHFLVTSNKKVPKEKATGFRVVANGADALWYSPEAGAAELVRRAHLNILALYRPQSAFFGAAHGEWAD